MGVSLPPVPDEEAFRHWQEQQANAPTVATLPKPPRAAADDTGTGKLPPVPDEADFQAWKAAQPRGVKAGVSDVIEAVKHPIETVKGMGTAVAEGLNKATAPIVGMPTNLLRIPGRPTGRVTKETPGAVEPKEALKGMGESAINVGFALAPELALPVRVGVNAALGAVHNTEDPLRGATGGALLGEALHGATKGVGKALGKAADVSGGAVEAGTEALKPPPAPPPTGAQRALKARLAAEYGITPEAIGKIGRRPAPPAEAIPEPAPDAQTFSTKGAVRRPAPVAAPPEPVVQPEARALERRAEARPEGDVWSPEQRAHYIAESQRKFATSVNKPWSQWSPEEKQAYFADQASVRSSAPWMKTQKPPLPTGNPDEIPTIEALKYATQKLGPEGFRQAVKDASLSGSGGTTIAAQTGNVERTVREIVRQDQIAAQHTEPRTYVPSSDPASKEPENARVRDIAEKLKTNPPDPVVQEAANEMAGRVPDGAVLVPLPSHTGGAEANARLAREIQKRVRGSMVLPVLERTRPVASSTLSRRAGQPGVDVETHVASMRATGAIPSDRPVVLVDNVETTGATGEAARRILQRPDAKTVAYAKAPIPPGEQQAVSWPPPRQPGEITPVASSNSEFNVRPGVMRDVNKGEQPAALASPLRLPEPTPADRAVVQPKGYKEVSPEEVAARKAAERPEPVITEHPARQEMPQGAKVDEQGLFFDHRTPNGALRPFNRVSTDGLIKAQRELMDQVQRDQQAAIYRNVEADVSGTQYGQHINVGDRTERGTTYQAEAAERLRNYEKVQSRLNQELEKRGLTNEDIHTRIRDQEELEAAIEQEAIHHADAMDEADTAFGDFGEEGKLGSREAPSPAAKPGKEGAAPPISDVLNVAKLNLGSKTAEQRMAAKLEEFRAQREANKQTFAEADVNRAEILNELRAGDPKALPTDRAKQLSGEELLARRDLVRENDGLIQSLSKRLEEAATPEEHAQAAELLDKAVAHNDALLSDLVTGSSQKGRDLNLLRRMAVRSLDPDVWRVQAKRMLGDKPLTAEIDAMIRKLAQEASDACG